MRQMGSSARAASQHLAAPAALLQMCQDWLDCVECFHYRCPRAHGEVGADVLRLAGYSGMCCGSFMGSWHCVRCT